MWQHRLLPIGRLITKIRQDGKPLANDRRATPAPELI